MAEYQPVEIRPVQPGDHAQALALAPRLTEGVAAWRDLQAVLGAVPPVRSVFVVAGQPVHRCRLAEQAGGLRDGQQDHPGIGRGMLTGAEPVAAPECRCGRGARRR
jgi:hypothetical protein